MKNIEEFYPLSPMQQGILFHTLYAPSSGVYVEQLSSDIQGNLNINVFQQAWQQLVEKHPILRTSLIWEGIKEPVQVVHKQVQLTLEQEDLSKLKSIEQQEHIKACSVAEREKGFEISQAPLMRLKLLQLGQKHYKFIWTHHHLLLDGWSSSLILQELFACYEALSKGKDIQIQKPHPYRNYIAWLQKQDLSKSESFWKKYLKGFSTVTSLGIDQSFGNQVNENKNYNTQILRLSNTETAALQSFARQQQLTLNTIMQGAWAILLSRYSGEEDIVFGGVVSGRPTTLAGVESMVGVFINTLPVRVSINPQEFLISWLKQLQIQQNEVRQYEYTPLIEIQKWSGIPNGQPLFETIFNFQNYPINYSLQQPIDNLKIFNINSFIHPHYPLNISVQVDSELSLEIFCDRTRFSDDKITWMLGHLRTLLLGMVANPQQRLSELPLLTDQERYQLLEEWNNTQVDYPQDQCIHQLFEAQVEKTPDAVAVVFENQQLTYRELNQRANQLAHYLQKLGVGTEVLVGICVERSLEMVVGLLGILKAGGAYVPLDPTYPQERLAFMLENSQVRVLLIQKYLLESLPAHKAKVICLDSNWELVAQEAIENPVHSVTTENLAYVIYTSGSTGKPKGAMNTHQAICNRLLWMQDYCQLTTADRVLQKTPFSFDVSVWEFFLPLLVGSRLVVAESEGHRDTNYLINIITKHQITTVHFVPSMLQVFLEQPGVEKCKCIKRVICSGEALPVELEKRFFQCLDAELHNLYGPTEAAIDVTFWKCGTYPSSATTVPIGRPIANIQIYLLDRYLNPVAIGVTGELHIGGVGLAKGYLNNPELTTEKFIPHPFNNKPGARLYKTGDLARYLPDGKIEFLGRIDYQVKIRGFRIELGEIEAVLNQHSAVREAVVMAQKDELGNQRLIAYVVANNPSLKINELRSFLQENLPEYMLPSAFMMLEAMPLTPNGKLDRRALPAPDQQRPELQSAFIAPQTHIEKQLAEIWMQVMGLKQVGVNDNFFELGGDSILSLQVIAKTNQVGLHFTPKQMFQHQTIAQLATVADIRSKNLSQQSIVTGKVPLTPIQHWFFEQNLPDPHYWNQSVLLEVQQSLDPALVKQALKSLLIHHDALRLQFKKEEIGWQAAIVPPNDEIPLTWLDLSELPPQQQETTLLNTANKLQSSLDLANGPLLQVAYFDLGINQPGRLLWVIHHLAVDGVSWRILIEDFQTAYQLLSKGETIQLPAKTTSYKQWSKQLQNYSQLANVQSESNYWCNINQAVKPIAVDFLQGNNTEASVRSISVNLSVDETQALLQDVPNTYRTQINNVLLAALGYTFKQWTGHSSLLVDLEGHGREEIFDDVDLSRTVGWFTTIFPVLLELANANNLGDTLQKIKEQMRRLPNRGFDYSVLRYLSNQTEIIEKLQAQPQPEVIFNYLGQFDQLLPQLSLFKLAKESTGGNHSPRGNRLYLLEVEGMVINSQLQLQWSYSVNFHRQETVEKLAQGMVEALRSLIIYCQTAEVNNYTPEDFPDADISQDQLDQVFAELALD